MVALLVERRTVVIGFFWWACCGILGSEALSPALSPPSTTSTSNSRITDSKIQFRAYYGPKLPTSTTKSQNHDRNYYVSKLNDEICDMIDDSTTEMLRLDFDENQKYVDFALSETAFLDYSDNHHSMNSVLATQLHSLSAAKVSILLGNIGVTTHIEEDNESSMAEKSPQQFLPQETFLKVYKILGNDNHAPPNPGRRDNVNVSFQVSVTTESKEGGSRAVKRQQRRRSHKKQNPASINRRVTQCLEETYGWKLHNGADKKPPLFSLRAFLAETGNADIGESDSMVVVECPVLTRVWPLLDPFRISSNPKRLESFLVAKAADIEVGDVVWDPLCKRGTLLIEAAKYWPMVAHYHGMDTNEGHLEHVRMNTASTLTSPIISTHRATTGMSQTTDSKNKGIIRLPTEDASVDKIMTCIVPWGGGNTHQPKRSNQFCRSTLLEWARVLKIGGTMTLVVDTEFVQHDRISSLLPHTCNITFVRSSAFKWGTRGRATIVIVKKISCDDDISPALQIKKQEDGTSYRTGLFDWERSGGSKQNLSGLARVRSETVPLLIPVTRHR